MRKENDNIIEIREELYYTVDDVYEFMAFVEESEEFQKQVDHELRKHFYHLYTKCKRNFKAINVLLKSDELENGYVEAVVLLRVMTESYFHLCYLMKTDKNKLLEEYQIMMDNKMKKMIEKGNIAADSPEDFRMLEEIKASLESKKTNIPKHLFKIPKLAKKTNNEALYTPIYEMFNTYVHFNPSTYISYGTFADDNTFNFDSYKPKPVLEARIIFYSVSIHMILLNRIIKYLKIQRIPVSIVQSIENWKLFRDTKSKIILQNTEDYT